MVIDSIISIHSKYLYIEKPKSIGLVVIKPQKEAGASLDSSSFLPLPHNQQGLYIRPLRPIFGVG